MHSYTVHVSILKVFALTILKWKYNTIVVDLAFYKYLK